MYGDMPRMLFERAGRVASRRMKHAHALLQQGDAVKYHAEIAKALTEYLGHKLQTPQAAFVLDDAVTQLEQHGVQTETTAALRACMERAEFARYTPGSDNAEARKELLDAAIKTIDRIEQSFGKRGRA
jgi:hypothetical protein